MSLTFKEMMQLEPSLGSLEHRMKLVAGFGRFLRDAEFQDIEEIRGLSIHLQTIPFCFAHLETRFTSELLLTVGPSGMHPRLKDPECYAVAHRWLWKNFPTCSHPGACEPQGEVVLADFSERKV